MKKLLGLLFLSLLFTNAFSQNGEILPNQGIKIKTTQTTTGVFGTSSTGISLQQNWPTIGFNQYRDASNVQRYIGTGYALSNFLDPSTGTTWWNSISTGTAGATTPSETPAMSLSQYGQLKVSSLGAINPAYSLGVGGNALTAVSTGGSFSVGHSESSGFNFINKNLAMDGSRIQASSGTFLSYSAARLLLNPFGGNVAINVGTNSFNSNLFVAKSATTNDGSAVFKGTTHFSHFHYSTNEDTYIRGGKDGSNIILSDVEAGGKVGIGVYPSTYKLEVNGTTRSKEVIVETGWADYVFEEDYQLPKLSEVEDFIKTNKHLPDVPSALEIQKNGAKLAQLTTIMMQKIEELTLYSIEQDKKIEKLQNDLVKLQNQK